MAESTKILQVTYGTYSCTLEGFEDPVEAMIVVTEYFRDLAERDPSFAAPDLLAGAERAEDLARLADRVREDRVAPSPAWIEAHLEEGAAADLSPEPSEGPAAVVPAHATAPADLMPAEDAAADMAAGGAPAEGSSHVAAVEAIPAGAADWGLEDEPGTSSQGIPSGRSVDRQRLLSAPPDADEAALSRMLTESDLRLSDPEATRRRATIASLKAAVAATEAARASSPSPEEEREARRDPFRHDLRQVVDSQGPGRIRPAPLRLVASQRVDLPAPPVPDHASEEARPLAAPTPTDFASFAAEMGARSLPDLIEAAAAWRAFVWELDDVSRPELLRLASQALAGEPSREEGLGAFGSLLREGRLDRVASGRFRVRDDSRFNPGRLAG